MTESRPALDMLSESPSLAPHPISFSAIRAVSLRVGVAVVIQGLKADIFPALYCGDVYMSLMCLVFLKSQ